MRFAVLACYSLMLLSPTLLRAQIALSVDVRQELHPVSPYLFGRNNSFSATRPQQPISPEEIVRCRDAGVTFFRESGGNNSTKYNWRKKLSSHPDWYNNVYTNDWDASVRALQEHFPGAQGMWAFQLIGKAARTDQHNFNDWAYNQSQWWEGVHQNLAGNGVANPAGTQALVEGAPDRYLQDWPADSTVAILSHWFDTLGVRKEGVRYWNMDNEPEIWSGTHDDVMPVQLSPEQFVSRYVEVALKARTLYPEIRLVGPVTANEWQWYHWDNRTISHDGRQYPWLEFFIKRIAEEQVRTGIRLLDVLDIHFYPTASRTAEIVQLHRVFFDRTFEFPEANGVKNSSGQWDNSQTKEYILGRVQDWLDTYMGPGHEVGLGVTETGLHDSTTPGAAAVWYASTLGEFMNHGVAIFTPWHWHTGMWETLHLVSNATQRIAVKGTSSNEELVSVYPTRNSTGDSLTLLLVNRSVTESQDVSLSLEHFMLSEWQCPRRSLHNLPPQETFISATQNHLKEETLTASSSHQLSLTLPPLSVTVLLLKGQTGDTPLGLETSPLPALRLFPNPGNTAIHVEWPAGPYAQLTVTDILGRTVHIQTIPDGVTKTIIRKQFSSGSYIVMLRGKGISLEQKLVVE